MTTTEQELVESWINGNRMWVKSKIKNKRNKQAILDEARELLSGEDLDDFTRNAMFG